MSGRARAATIAQECEMLDWDSEFFGLRIARLTADRLDEAAADAALAWSEERGVDCLYFLAPGDDAPTVRVVEARSFALVDVRVDLHHSLEGGAHDDPGRVRHARAADRPALKPVARDSFTASRFFFDGRFARERCADLFETWLVGGLAGELADAVLVAEVDGRAAGFVTCELADSGEGRIGLLGVSASARGRGVGEALCRGALCWFTERGAPGVTVTTQGRRAGALRLYERCGFTTSAVGLWYHRWFDRPAR